MSGLGRVAILSLAATAAVGGCNRGAAHESLRVAEEALEAARADLESYAPKDLRSLRQGLEAARADLADGRYTDALRVAQAFPARVRAALARSGRKRRELLSEWDELSRQVPSLIHRAERRVILLAGSPPVVAQARTLGEAKTAWAEAQRRHRKDEVAAAVTLGEGVEARLQTLTRRLSLLRLPGPVLKSEPATAP